MATKYAGQNALNKLMQIIKTALGNKADKTDLDGKLDKTGGTMTGDLIVSGASITAKSSDGNGGSIVADRNVSAYNFLIDTGSGDKMAIFKTGDTSAAIRGQTSAAYIRFAVGTPDGDNDAATKAYVDSKVAAGGVTVDDSVSSTSTNPVQNKAIKAELDKKLDKSGGTVTGFLRVNDSVYAEGHISTGLNISAKMLQLNAEGSTDDNPVLVDVAPNADDASALDVLAMGGGATKYGSIIVATPTDAQTNYAATVEYVKNKVAGLQTADQVQTAINSAISGVYTPKGSIAFKSLPTAAAGNKGWVYNVTDAFTTTSAFVEGTGHTYAAGTNVVCVDAGSGSYKWDVLAGTIDLTELTATEVQTLWDSI